MKKSRLTKILVEGNPELLKQLSLQVEELVEVRLERKPKTGLIMLKVRDSVSKEPFYMGEVLVSECTVSIEGTYGMGTIMGEEFERSYQIAVIDAAFNVNLPITKTWLKKLEEEETAIHHRHQQEHAMVANSRVNFDTMEDYNDKS
ncbi:phosphonate C-P lyase system protein PhnG [Bacillus salitolerans]|uniref:Phosphonate C-P lyase system protein PhnG n=1 Tax=Bacillus salitolerans TaxID=1437434 RepID=A0ABW4LMA4_9BACI